MMFYVLYRGHSPSPPSLRATGEFYGHNLSTANLELIAEFFDRYPEYAERAFLSIKVRFLRVILSCDIHTDETLREPKREG